MKKNPKKYTLNEGMIDGQIEEIKIIDIVKQSEIKQWEEIQNTLKTIDNNKDKLIYLHKRMAEYYQNLPSTTEYASGVITTKFPNLGKLFLDSKIEKEIIKIWAIQEIENSTRINHKSVETETDIEIDSEILEQRTKTILLEHLGVIKFLKSRIDNDTELPKFLADLFSIEPSTKPKTKKNIYDSIRKDLRYINLPNNDYYPKTKDAIKKVNSVLSKYGLPIINEPDSF